MEERHVAGLAAIFEVRPVSTKKRISTNVDVARDSTETVVRSVHVKVFVGIGAVRII